MAGGEPRVGGALMTGLDVLEALGSAAGPIGLSELARTLQADNGHVHRLLGVLTRRGYALDNEELSIGVRCVASPVVDIGGNIRASIGISGPATRLDEEKIGKCTVLVCTAAKSLSELLGGEWDFPLPSSEPVISE